MNCQVCGNNSGKYPLCRDCNAKKEIGEVIKCSKCGKWHYASIECTLKNTVNTETLLKTEPVNSNALNQQTAPVENTPSLNPATLSNTAQNHATEAASSVASRTRANPIPDNKPYLYRLKNTLISKSEQAFYDAIKNATPEGYLVFPQINLMSFIEKTDSSPFHNELFRIVDFLITDSSYRPKLVIEINDQSHFLPDRKERDEKVKKICEEAGIPIINLWTHDGINPTYIKTKLKTSLESLPVARIHHFDPSEKQSPSAKAPMPPRTKPTYRRRRRQSGGCYVATCVYGSYDCPQVWMLRRFRDTTLSATWYGNAFIDLYYAVSPSLVKLFGKSALFRKLCKMPIDRIVKKLKAHGVSDTPYDDQ